jgi:hypothetical protein
VRDLAAEVFLVAVERNDDLVALLAAERHDIGCGKAKVRRHPHLGHRHHRRFQRRVVDLAALENFRQRMAHQFADAKLALRGARDS